MPLFIPPPARPFFAALIPLTVLLASGCGRQEPAAVPSATASAAPAAAAPGTTTPPAPAPAPKDVQALLGRWQRSDGGYSLELRRADPSGVLEAAYFNPKPIRVSRAIWMRGPQGLQAMVELNDVGYPGATYVLSHDAATDRLVGQYTQPAMQQSFDIDFVRQK